MILKEIKSRKNKTFLEALKICKLKKYRELLGKFPAEGTRICVELLKCNIKVENLFFTENSYNKNKILLDDLAEKSKLSYRVTENLIESLSNTNSTRGSFIHLIFATPKNRQVGDSSFYSPKGASFNCKKAPLKY